MTALLKRLLLFFFVLPLCIAICIPVLLIAAYRRGIFSATSAIPASRILADNRPSLTAELVCAYRAISTYLQIIDDPFAEYFLDWDARFLAFTIAIYYRVARTVPTGAIGYLAARTLAFDEFLSTQDVTQVVILGAGFDSRAYRLPFRRPSEVVVFEVDAPSTQLAKRACVRSAAKRNSEIFASDNAAMMREGRVKYVTCDFSSSAKENFLQRLRSKGFDPRKPTAFLMEGGFLTRERHHGFLNCGGRLLTTELGVASYLTWEALRATLELVSRGGCGKGTAFAFNVLNAETVNAKSSATAKVIRGIGEEWKYGMGSSETAREVFGPLGYEIEGEMSFEEALERYVGVKKGGGKRSIDGRLVFMTVR